MSELEKPLRESIAFVHDRDRLAFEVGVLRGILSDVITDVLDVKTTLAGMANNGIDGDTARALSWCYERLSFAERTIERGMKESEPGT